MAQGAQVRFRMAVMSDRPGENTGMTAGEIISALVAIGDMESRVMLIVGSRSGWLTSVEDDHGQYVFLHAENYETEDGDNG